MLREQNKKIIYFLITILAISVLIYWRWLVFPLLQSSDWWFFYSEELKNISIFSFWNNSSDFGSIDFTIWKLPILAIYKLFATLGFNSIFADKILIFLPIVLFAGIGSFLLVRKVTNSNIAGLVGSCIFSYNTYFLSINTQGHEFITASCVSAVFTIWLFIINLENKKLIYAILTGLSLFIVGAYDLRILYITIWLLIFYTIYYLIFVNKNFSIKNLAIILIYAFCPIIIVILLNLYWLYPSYVTNSLNDNGGLNRELFGNKYWKIANILTLYYPFWNGKEPVWFISNRIPAYFWFIPIAAFWGLLIGKKNKNIVFFALIAILGIFLGKQTNPPFGNIYTWLYLHLPGFNAFREASKFYFLTILGYSVLIGYLASWIYRNTNGKKWLSLFGYLLIIIIIAIFLWNAKPVITGEIGTMFVPRKIPNDYLIFKNYIAEQKSQYFRILWIPQYSRWSYYDSAHPRVGINIFDPSLSSFKNFIAKNDSRPANQQIISLLDQDFSNNLLDAANIKYVVVPLEDNDNQDNFFPSYGSNRQFYLDKLSQISYLKKIDINTKDLVVYENEKYKPTVFVPNEVFIIDSLDNAIEDYNNLVKNNRESDFIFLSTKEDNSGIGSFINKKPEKVEFESPSPIKKIIHIKSAHDPFFLALSEKYNSGWKVFADNKKINNFIGSWSPFTKLDGIAGNQHYSANDLINAWQINPEQLNKQGLAQKNIDGNYDIDMIIEYWPQRLFIFWSAISCFILLLIIAIVYYFWKKRNNNYPRITHYIYKNSDAERRVHPDWLGDNNE